LKTFAVVKLDGLVSLALVAVALMAFNSDQVMCRRILVREFPDDVIRRQLAFASFVPFAIYKKVNLVFVMMVDVRRRVMCFRVWIARFGRHFAYSFIGMLYS
jgi:hypothetical protein